MDVSPIGSGPQNVYGSSGFPPQIKQMLIEIQKRLPELESVIRELQWEHKPIPPRMMQELLGISRTLDELANSTSSLNPMERGLLKSWGNRLSAITNPKDYNTALNAIDNVSKEIKAWTGQ